MPKLIISIGSYSLTLEWDFAGYKNKKLATEISSETILIIFVSINIYRLAMMSVEMKDERQKESLSNNEK